MARYGRHGSARHSVVGQGRRGALRPGKDRCGRVWQVRRGVARHGVVGQAFMFKQKEKS